MKCRNCGKEVKENWKKCPWCKMSLEKIAPKCPNCGEEVDDSWDSCPVCDYPLHVASGTPSIGQMSSILSSFDDILPDDSSLDLVAGDIAEAQQRQQEAQNAEYQKKLNFARIACIREQYAQAQEIYDNLAQDDPTDINAYIGYVRIVTQNYTQYQGVEVEKAIRVVEQVGCDVSENNLDKEYRDYLAKRKAEFDRIAAEEAKKKKAEAERKAKEEAERKAREEAERKAREEAERKAREEAERKAKEEAERKKRELSKNFDVKGTTLVKYKGKEKEVVIPDCITSIGDKAFCGCYSLTSITIPSSVTSIEAWAFADCSSLISITIPNSVTSIGKRAFCDCSSLTSITIPDNVTSIGDFAFHNCSSLTSITIPNSVKSIGEWAFYECRSLKKVYAPRGLDLSDCRIPSGCQVIRT